MYNRDQIVYVNDERLNMLNIKAKVVAVCDDKVYFRIVADKFEGLNVYHTDLCNATVNPIMKYRED